MVTGDVRTSKRGTVRLKRSPRSEDSLRANFCFNRPDISREGSAQCLHQSGSIHICDERSKTQCITHLAGGVRKSDLVTAIELWLQNWCCLSHRVKPAGQLEQSGEACWLTIQPVVGSHSYRAIDRDIVSNGIPATSYKTHRTNHRGRK